MEFITEDLKQITLGQSYRAACEVLIERVSELEKRIESLELALSVYRKDSIRGTTENLLG